LGRDIHTLGITPDIIVEYEKDKIVELPDPYNSDNQLFETIKIVIGMKAVS